MKKFIKSHKVLCILCVLILAGAVYQLAQPKSSGTVLVEETAARRDISTYNSFVGNVEPGSSRDVLSKVSSQVLELHVEEGDKVCAGDIIAVLDSSSAEYTIDLREASLRATQANYNYAISDAQRAYDNYKETLDSDLNSTLRNAEIQLNSAKTNLDTAQETYDTAKKKINNGTYAGTASAYSAWASASNSYSNAYSAYSSAAAASNQASAALSGAQSALSTATNNLLTSMQVKPGYADASLELILQDQSSLATTNEERQLFIDYTASKSAYDAAASAAASASAQASTLKAQADSASSAADSAYATFDAARTSALESVKTQLDAAKTSYDSAKASYDMAELAVKQQLGSYAAAVDRAKGTSSTEASQLEIQNLKDSLGDYVITAPCDGTVTMLNLKEGGMAGMNATAATLSDLESMKISIKVDEYSILNTRVGSPVTIFIDSIGRSYDGVITQIANTATIEGGVSYFKATVSFDADEFVRGGMSVEVRLTNVDEKNALSLSVDAIRYHEDNTAYVLVGESANTAQERAVTLGASDGSFVIITDGLQENDKVWVTPRMGFDFMVMPGGMQG